MRHEILESTAALAARGAELVAAAARQALAERGVFHLAVSGGTTPGPMFAALARMELPWERVHVWQVDERVAPDRHPDRNLVSLVANLASAAVIHAMPVLEDDVHAAARRYGSELPRPFDMVQLGLGADGHTASLFPGDPAVDEEDAPVFVTLPQKGRRRMTLTLPVLNTARARLWLLAGADKRDALRGLLAGDLEVVAGRVTHEGTVVLSSQVEHQDL